MAQRNSVNKVILVGHLGTDPEVRYTPNGDAVANLSLATTERFKNRDGEQTERTEWHRLVVWRATAEFAKNYLKKGQLIYAEGRLQTRKWEDRDGVKRYSTEIQVDQLTPLGGLQGAPEAGRAASGDAPEGPGDEGEDDIPF